MAHGITVNTTQFEFSHGKAPKGRGSWAFKLGARAELFWHNGTFTEARKAAKAEARRVGVHWVEVQP
jgi:hypothetical protein